LHHIRIKDMKWRYTIWCRKNLHSISHHPSASHRSKSESICIRWLFPKLLRHRRISSSPVSPKHSDSTHFSGDKSYNCYELLWSINDQKMYPQKTRDSMILGLEKLMLRRISPRAAVAETQNRKDIWNSACPIWSRLTETSWKQPRI
jgi:hypothetical protein